MPYHPISTLSRRGEKIAPFLSIQNTIGMVVLAGPIWLIVAPAPGLLRFVAVIVGAGVGYLVTLDVRGMSLYERLLWVARGQVRILVRGRTITPADLPGTAVQARIIVTPRDGPFRRRYATPGAGRPHNTIDALVAARLRQAQRRPASPTAVPALSDDGAMGVSDGRLVEA